MLKMFQERIKKLRKDFIYSLPKEALDRNAILARIVSGSKESKKLCSTGGGGVYTNDEDHWNFVGDVMKHTISANPIHIFEFQQISQFEAEIIKMVLELYHGTPSSCGLTTSGGTESILLAMMTYREWGLKVKGITKPNIVCSSTAHAAFDKACFCF